MNVKCPYCSCCYEIGRDLLQSPSGNKNLGYGWWLRCYRCHKKWWLKNSDVELEMNSPLKADRLTKIDKLSTLIKKEKSKQKKKFNTGKIIKYIVLATFIFVAILAYHNKEVFYNYLITKAKHISKNVAKRIIMTDVRYFIENGNVSVNGNVVNEDKVIAKINGVKITIFDDDSEVISWNSKLDTPNLLPEQNIPFSSSNKLPPGEIKNIRVEVSVF